MAAESKLPMSAVVNFREASLEDYAAIAAVLTRNGLYIKSREEWEHLWVGNPVYQKASDWTIGWVAENADREIVGYIGNIPLSAEFKGREIISACVTSLVMDSRHRGRGYAGFLIRRILHYRTAELVIVSTANAVSANLLKSLGMHRVPAGDWGHAAFWITNYRGFVASVLSKRGWPKLLSYPGAAGLALRDRLKRDDSWMRRNRQELQVCSSFDQRFDRFWEELKRAYPERLLPTRSREALQWHYKYVLAQGRAWIVTVGDGSRLMAYAVFRRRDVPEHALKRIQLVDFQVLNGDMQILVAMLAWAVAKCQKDGIHVLEAFGFRPDKQAIIDNLAPHRRQLPSWWYYYNPVNKDLAPELRDPAVWDPSHFDGDASL